MIKEVIKQGIIAMLSTDHVLYCSQICLQNIHWLKYIEQKNSLRNVKISLKTVTVDYKVHLNRNCGIYRRI